MERCDDTIEAGSPIQNNIKVTLVLVREKWFRDICLEFISCKIVLFVYLKNKYTHKLTNKDFFCFVFGSDLHTQVHTAMFLFLMLRKMAI